ncbi:transducin beta-like protein 2 isoform X2 [Penaeus chinensis]|uniref:transducin beta-like protein 2 isoform X2 n=1 Tax=Penaeus chinensis TaxID=139456 RepID=UPI001FB65260|nr:transducin beta-like protein 2 isoform X2 [Penaeus chinensis]
MMAGEETHVSSAPTMLFLSIVIGATILVLGWLIRLSRSQTSNTAEKQSKPKRKEPQAAKKPPPPKPQKQSKTQKKPAVTQYTHQELITTLKGHTGSITGGSFSSDGKHFITAADDRTVLIWNADQFTQREHKSVRGNIEFDYATHIRWMPNSKGFTIFKKMENTIAIYKVSKTSAGMIGNAQEFSNFPKQEDEIADIITFDVAVTGNIIMTCNSKNQIVIWNFKGEVLEQFDTRHGDTYSATLSPCGRFIATTGFTPDAKVWRLKLGASDSFEGVKRAYDLTGHKASIYSCSMNADCTRMVTVSKDGTWKLFDTDIEFEKGQRPYQLLTIPYDSVDQKVMIRMSPDGRTVLLAVQANLIFYSAITGEKLNVINDIYGGDIIDVMFDPTSKQVVTLGDRHARVFHNVAGYIAAVQDLEQCLKKSTNSAMSERIKKQIKEAKAVLAGVKKSIEG